MVRRPRPGEIAGNYSIPVYEHDRQDRVDLIVKDKNTLAFLDERICTHRVYNHHHHNHHVYIHPNPHTLAP